MEKNPIKIIGIKFSEDCPEALFEPAKKYYELNDLFEFKFTIDFIKKKFDIKDKDISNIRLHSKLIYEIYCDRCEAFKKQFASNKTEFNKVYKYSFYKPNVCQECKELERKLKQQELEKQQQKIKEEQEKKKQEIIQKLSKAIDDKSWRKLNPFQFGVLKNCLSFHSFNELKQYYWNREPTRSGFKELFSTLRILASENLIIIETEFNRSKGYEMITNYKYLEKLKTEFEYNFEINDTPKIKSNPTQGHQDKESVNVLKMKLTINDCSNHPDSPLYAGTITFDKKIIIEPKVQYTFAQWKRSNDDLFFTLIPTTEIEKLPVQKTLSQEPKILQEHITNFLNNIEIEK